MSTRTRRPRTRTRRRRGPTRTVADRTPRGPVTRTVRRLEHDFDGRVVMIVGGAAAA